MCWLNSRAMRERSTIISEVFESPRGSPFAKLRGQGFETSMESADRSHGPSDENIGSLRLTPPQPSQVQPPSTFVGGHEKLGGL